MSNKKYTADLVPEQYYHIYNRSNNKEALFKNEGNRFFFLQKYKSYVSPFCKTFAYCLLGNHFHFLIQIKDKVSITQTLKNMSEIELSKYQKEFLAKIKMNEQNAIKVISDESYHQLIAKQFRRFFIAYAKAFNKQHQREGNLFNRPFKRITVQDDAHFSQLIFYIHYNPTHHNISNDFSTYKWSSYSTLLTNKTTTLQRDEVMNWFGGVKNFETFHKGKKSLEQIEGLIIEE